MIAEAFALREVTSKTLWSEEIMLNAVEIVESHAGLTNDELTERLGKLVMIASSISSYLTTEIWLTDEQANELGQTLEMLIETEQQAEDN